MADRFIQYPRSDGQYEIVEFDVLEQHGVTHSAKATQFPVETGAVITDHVLQDADVVQFTGLVTNTPLPSGVGMTELVGREYKSFEEASEAGQFKGRAHRAYAALRDAQKTGTAVEIWASGSPHTDMVIESLTISESSDSGDALTFSISARQIRTTSTKTVEAPKIEAAKPVAEQGRKPTTLAEEYDTEGTAAWNLKQKIINSAR